MAVSETWTHLRRMHLHPWVLIREGFYGFLEDNALTRGAAIAFYAVTAMAPVLFITTTIAAIALGQDAVTGAITYQLRQIMSPQSADLVQLAILHVRGGHHTIWGSLIGVVALIVTASGVFTEIEDALNVIWRAPRHESYLYQILRGRMLSLALVMSMGLLLLVSLLVASGVGMLGNLLKGTGLSELVIGPVNFTLSFIFVSLIFAAMYKVLPNKALQWRDVAVGACGTALLFQAGQAVIGFYLANFVTANIYGAAGGLIVLLIWIYYSAQIFL
jgi:membrane protein